MGRRNSLLVARKGICCPTGGIASESLWSYLRLVHEVSPDIDIGHIGSLAVASSRHYRRAAKKSPQPKALLLLQERWYSSLAKGKPDYGVYDADEYLAELWACWVCFSSHYLSEIMRPQSLPPHGVAHALLPLPVVVDLGCGVGMSTARLKQMYPESRVVGTNLPNTVQTRVAAAKGERCGFGVAVSLDDVDAADGLVVALDYFEHHQQPIEHLLDVLRMQPRALVVVNTFGQPAIGHFDSYRHNGEWVAPKTVSKMFGETLKAAGYEQLKAALWNQKPTCWIAAKGRE